MTSFYPSGNPLQRAVGSLRHEGPGAFAYKLASELGFRRVLLLERLLDEPIAEVASTTPVAFAVLSGRDVDDYLAHRQDADRARVEARLASGETCFALRREGRIVSTCWSAGPGYWSGYLECPMPVADGEAYLLDAWTDAASRGLGLAHVLCVHQLRHLRAKGFRRVLRGTVPENRSALRAHAKSGFRPIAMLGRVRIGPWRWHFMRDWRGV